MTEWQQKHLLLTCNQISELLEQKEKATLLIYKSLIELSEGMHLLNLPKNYAIHIQGVRCFVSAD